MTEHTQYGCEWPTSIKSIVDGKCGISIEGKLWSKGIHLCRQHALLVWSVMDEEMQDFQKNSTRSERIAEQTAREAEHAARQRAERENLPPLQAPPEGYVYYLRVGPHIKIGYASNLERRLSSYPPDTELLAVESGTLQDEQQLHRTFKAFRVSGREWYDQSPVLMNHIAEVAKNERHTWWDDTEWRRKNPTSEHVAKPKYWR
ncbi:GIY-YIG nuclease family protein [Rhodococcus pseudokoreensis]|uniref:GIY-YIG nuclease family protein n=1 Tax=Rhodococcus pseudokoreensis TaxID=2811421 RepID=A0A974WAJ0_9NOCA|nr:GIY-YIG nuclease family protein [Rhodococcus pseudokoreensis]QSE94178.1 GIY-YIG nuclease family protein [Rhodococcus pseudokoreensis]